MADSRRTRTADGGGKQSRLVQWIPAIAMAVAVVAGYVQLSEAVKANSRTNEQQAVALERIIELLVNDARHDQELLSIRRDLEIIWAELKEHREKSPYDNGK